MICRDLKQTIRASSVLKIGNSTLRFQPFTILCFIVLGFLLFLIVFCWVLNSSKNVMRVVHGLESGPSPTIQSILSRNPEKRPYNRTYPLSLPLILPNGIKYRIAIISDLDENSKKGNKWISYLKKGFLTYNPTGKTAAIEWDSNEPIELSSGYSLNGRGMELSELVVFDGKLLSFDDRTGIVYVIDPNNNSLYPWVILMDGDGKTMKGFKSEWAAVKDGYLFVGSMGKEWTSGTGDFVNTNPQWIKVVSATGEVNHVNWQENYNEIRRSVEIEFPGYMIHESGVWSPVHKRWYFLPRRSSKLKYNEKTDERMGTNILLSCNPSFSSVQATSIGEIVPTRGFSSFKFVPDTEDSVVVALKSVEDEGTSATYIMVFTMSGEILVPETKVADLKYEGIEFI